MQYILICIFFYIILVFADLMPLFKKKDKKTLYVSVPIYIVTLILNVLIGLNVGITGLNMMIADMIKSIFHMQ
jgi:low affinity Fe/Cu permease